MRFVGEVKEALIVGEFGCLNQDLQDYAITGFLLSLAKQLWAKVGRTMVDMCGGRGIAKLARSEGKSERH